MFSLLTAITGLLTKIIGPVLFLFAGKKLEENSTLKKEVKSNEEIHATRNRVRFDDSYRDRVRHRFGKK